MFTGCRQYVKLALSLFAFLIKFWKSFFLFTFCRENFFDSKARKSEISNNLETSSRNKKQRNSISGFVQAARKFIELKQKCAALKGFEFMRLDFPNCSDGLRLELPEIEFLSVKSVINDLIGSPFNKNQLVSNNIDYVVECHEKRPMFEYLGRNLKSTIVESNPENFTLYAKRILSVMVDKVNKTELILIQSFSLVIRF